MTRTIRWIAAGMAAIVAGGILPAGAANAPARVRVVRQATAPVSSGYYAPNRPPLAPTAFMKLPIGSITPHGWLRRQLELDASDLTGHMMEISDYLKYDGNGWVDPKGKDGWEEMPYWLRGFGDLGYVLKDTRIIKQARKWIDGIITSQRPDGYFGPERLRTDLEGGPDLWPHMLVLNVLQSYQEYSGDARVIPFITRFMRYMNTLPPVVFHRGWGAVRWADGLGSLYWLYNRTGGSWLLDLAQKIHENSADYTTSIPTWHNVNISQGIREPAEYWQQAKAEKFLIATESDYDEVMDLYGQMPGGGFAGDENCRPAFRDPRQGFETCGIVEYMHTFEMMTRISGNPVWADRAEELAFNSLPAALSPDHKGTHYITSVNSIELNNTGKQHGQFNNGPFPMQAYKPGIHDYRCCPHNLGIGWPYYAENLWLATADRGLCTSLYAASDVRARVADGTTVRFTEQTGYPFEDTVRLRLSTPKTVDFPLYLRIPGWCEGPVASVNGRRVAAQADGLSYLVLNRRWRSGDTVTLKLPMHVAVRTWTKNKDSVSVDYGPLTYSLDIGEKWVQYGGTRSWPEYNVIPTGAWNYGLVLDRQHPARSFEVVRKPGPVPEQPFTPETSPIRIRARARMIPGWQADADGVVGVLQPSPARTSQPVQTVTLIPMGAARLRIASFPTVGNGPNAHEWVTPAAGPRASASHLFGGDTLDALHDGVEPARSGDQDIPRFTWWDHRGTVEWVQYDFKKPTRISNSAVYWFDDTGKGQCRIPQSWRLLYKDGDTWKPVVGAGSYGVARDRYNRISFLPVTTAAVRVEVQLEPGFSGGILEWKVE